MIKDIQQRALEVFLQAFWRNTEFDHVRVIYPQAPDITYQVAHGGLEQGLW